MSIQLPFTVPEECQNLAIAFFNEYLKTTRASNESEAVQAATMMKKTCDMYFKQVEGSRGKNETESVESTNADIVEVTEDEVVEVVPEKSKRGRKPKAQ